MDYKMVQDMDDKETQRTLRNISRPVEQQGLILLHVRKTVNFAL